MTKLSRYITARRISLGLILGLAGILYLSTIIPQRLDSPPEKIADWRQNHKGILWLVDSTHLHRVYAQPWFAFLILCAALSLGVSSIEQFQVARQKFRSTTGGEELASNLPAAELLALANSRGFRFEHNHDAHRKFIRHPWGYFGIVMLHAGMTMVILASAFVAATNRKGALTLIEGEEPSKRKEWDVAEHGLMSSPLQLPETIRLNRVKVEFDEKQQPVSVESNIVITDDKGSTETLTAAINRIQPYRGLRIYHSSQYGDVFTVRFTDRSGIAHIERIAVQQPINPTTAGYSHDFRMPWSPYQFSAKYFADREKKSMLSNNPELTLRINDSKGEVARTSMIKDGQGVLGDYRVDLLTVQKWSKLIFVDITGMPVIFAGFAIIMLGGLVHYMTPPQELIAARNPDGTFRVYWKATIFTEFYKDEFYEIKSALKRGNPC